MADSPAIKSVGRAASSGGVTSLSCPIPAGVVAGDVLLMLVKTLKGGGSPAVATSTGWTVRSQDGASGDGFAVLSRVATGAEGANATIALDASALTHVVILAYSGASVVNAFAKAATFSSSATPPLPSVTTTVTDAMVVGVALCGAGTSGTPAAGWTERADDSSAAAGSLVYAMDRSQAAAGASPAASVTVTGGGGAIWTYAIAIAPAVATTYNDSASGTVTASGTGTESHHSVYDDSGTATINVSGTGVGSHDSVSDDSASGIVTVSGTGIDDYATASTDSGSGTVTVSGSGTESYLPPIIYPSGYFSKIKFGDGLDVTDEGSNVIRVDAGGTGGSSEELPTRLPAIEVMAATGFQNQYEDDSGSGEYLTWEPDHFDLSNGVLAFLDESDPTRIVIPNRMEIGLFLDFDFTMVADIYSEGKQFKIQPLIYSGNLATSSWLQIEAVVHSSPFGMQVMSLEHNIYPYVVGSGRERMWASWTSRLYRSDPHFAIRVFLIQTLPRETDVAGTLTIEEHRVDLNPTR